MLLAGKVWGGLTKEAHLSWAIKGFLGGPASLGTKTNKDMEGGFVCRGERSQVLV